MPLTLTMMGLFVPSDSEIQLASINFEEGGVVFSYGQKSGIRKDGALQLMSNLFVGHHADYRDELDDLMDKALEVIRDALEDYATADVVDLDEGDDDDNDRGMGE
jgi:hypothetical protein